MSSSRAPLASILTATLVAATGCGGSGSSSPATSASRAASATPAARTAPSASTAAAGASAHAQLAAFASAVNLRPGDVPGFAATAKKHGRHGSAGNRAFEDESQYEHCYPGAGEQAKWVLKADSDSFASTHGLHFEQANSGVAIAPTVAKAKRQLQIVAQAISDTAVSSCLARAFDASGGQSRTLRTRAGTVAVKVGDLRIVPLQPGPLRGTSASVGMTVAMNLTYTFTARGRTVTLPTAAYIDLLGFGVGRATVSLSTVAIGEQFPPELEAGLFSRLVSRALAAGHRYPAVES
jgi:hypothetical protein